MNSRIPDIPSYQRFHYGLRPAKQIERKMMLEGYQRLVHFAPLEDYRYIGFGSLYFVDFSMIHRLLGIKHLVSIEDERDSVKQQRFRFNAPFACVTMEFGHSNAVLPRLTWDNPAIVWLDYDGRFDTGVLTDVATVVASAVSGSFLAVTVNAEGIRPKGKKLRRGNNTSASEAFLKRLPLKNRPAGLTDSDVNMARLGMTMRAVLVDQIEQSLDKRNATLGEDEKLKVEPVFYFEYADGAKMATYGFVLVAQTDTAKFLAGQWSALPFVRSGDTPFIIRVPLLTHRERQYLERQLPCASTRDLLAWGIDDEAKKDFSDLYPYYPTYLEVIA